MIVAQGQHVWAACMWTYRVKIQDGCAALPPTECHPFLGHLPQRGDLRVVKSHVGDEASTPATTPPTCQRTGVQVYVLQVYVCQGS